MSSSFLDRSSRAIRLTGASLAVAACCAQAAAAANTYFIPTVTVGGEYDTNRALVTTGDEKGLTGYSGTAEALWGGSTPRSDTQVRPRIRYQAFPSDTRLNQTEGSLDFKTNYLTPRTEFNLLANYNQLDLFNAEFVDVGFDPFNPNPPVDAGQAVSSEQRKTAEVNPTYLYRWNERMGIGTELDYQSVRYTADVPVTNKQDFDNWQAKLYLQRRVNPKNTIEMGGYVGRFQTKSGVDTTDSVVGAAFDLKHDFTPRNQMELSLTVERNKINIHDPNVNVPEENTTDVGAEISAVHHFEISDLRVVLGRDISPTGEGGRATLDQVRLQYDRELSERLTFTGLVSAYSQRALANQVLNLDNRRDVGTGALQLQWMMTPTWFIRGGYDYNYQKRTQIPGSAGNNRVFLLFGYQALDSTHRR